MDTEGGHGGRGGGMNGGYANRQGGGDDRDGGFERDGGYSDDGDYDASSPVSGRGRSSQREYEMPRAKAPRKKTAGSWDGADGVAAPAPRRRRAPAAAPVAAAGRKKAATGGGASGRGPNVWIEALKIARRELRLEHTFAPPTKGSPLHSLAMQHKSRLEHQNRAGGGDDDWSDNAPQTPPRRAARGFKLAPQPRSRR